MTKNQPEFSIDGRLIGENYPTYIIAELSGNHNQDLNLALKTIKAAAEAGVDAIKLQTYTADTITLDSDLPHFMAREDSPWAGQKIYDLYKKAYTPWEWHKEIFDYANSLGIQAFSSPFDPTSVEFLEELNVPAYKIASFEITDIPLIELVASKGKPVIMSTGIAKQEDIDLAIKTCLDAGNSQIAILKCTSAYPTPLEDVNLRAIPLLKEIYGTVVGLSDHTMGAIVPNAAVAMGARIVEKHIIYDRALGGVDSSFSMNKDEFALMVKSIRDTEKAMGIASIEPNERQLKGRRMSRSLFAVEDIGIGDKITTDNVMSKRPGIGLHPKFYKTILGKKASKSIKKGAALSLEDINEDVIF